MARYIVINSETNIIENAIVLEDVNNWTCPENCYIVKTDEFDIGETYEEVDNGNN